MGVFIKGCSFHGQISGAGASQPSYPTSWYNGIYINGGWNSTVEDCYFRGADSTYAGYFVTCTDHTTPLTFWKNTVYFCQGALLATEGSFAEGLNAYGNQIVACLDGFRLLNGQGAPLAQIFGNHMNVARFAVHAVNRPQIMIGDNLIYNWNFQGYGQGVGGVGFVAFQLEGGCDDSDIRNNTILGFRGQTGVSGNSQGIVIQDANGSTIQGNKIRDCNTGIDGVARFNGVLMNNIFRGCPTRIVSLTGGCRTQGNWDYSDANNPSAV
jgi:hypothetical protein